MPNQINTNTFKLDTIGSINTTGATILWIMHYAALDNGEVKILDASSGKEIFYYKNIDVSALGSYQFFHIGGQRVPGIYLDTLTTNNIVWIGVK